MPSQRRYDAVVFDLLTALLNSWTLWNRAAGSAEDGLRWRRAYLELTYGAGLYRPYEDIVRAGGGASRRRDLVRRHLVCTMDRAAAVARNPPRAGGAGRQGSPRRGHELLAHVGRGCCRVYGRALCGRRHGRERGVLQATPEPYLAVLKMLGTNPARTLFVAGSAADVPGAKGAGMPVFWHNRMGLQPVDDARPDFGAASLEPLLDLV